jgi:hypothetical protein
MFSGINVLRFKRSRSPPLVRAIFGQRDPGLKPWAILLCPFGAKDSSRLCSRLGHPKGGARVAALFGLASEAALHRCHDDEDE